MSAILPITDLFSSVMQYFTMNNVMVFWLVAIVVLAIVEIATIQLVAIWFAIGGVGALIAESFGMPIPGQFTVFIVISSILLAATRPMCRRFLSTKKVSTNADRNIGKIAVVREEISNLAQTGAATISGITWTARSIDDAVVIPVGEKVKIERIEGVKLIVSKASEQT